MFGSDLFNLLVEDSPSRTKLFVSNTCLILRRLNFNMCPFDNEISVVMAFNLSVVVLETNLQFIDLIDQLE